MMNIGRILFRQSVSISRKFHVSAMAPVAVGDKVPSVDLFESRPGNKVNRAELCTGKKVRGLASNSDLGVCVW